MSYNILTLNAISPVYQDTLPSDQYNVSPSVTSPDAIMVRSADMHEYAINDQLLCVGRAGAGVNNIPLDKMAEAGVVVFNAPGANANAVKEMVCAALLFSSRKIASGVEWVKTLTDVEDIDKAVEKGKKQFVGPELSGKTLGVVGLGAIGVLVANMSATLGMNVLGYDPYISVANAWKLSGSVKHCTNINELLENSDYLTLHLPLMDSTRNTINAEVLRRMKHGAALINYARGALVDEEAVIEALESGNLRVYATDFPSKALLNTRNVVLTPHMGASTPESEDNCVRMVAKQIDDYIKYGSITNAVNFPNCPLLPMSMPRITALHKNIPNVIGPITTIFSSEGINIENMVNQSRGTSAYTVLDVSKVPSEEALLKLSKIDGVYKIRVLKPQR